MNIQAALRALREEMQVSQEKLARLLDTSVRTVLRWELSQPPTGARLLTLAVLARDHDRPDLAHVFAMALIDEYGWRDHAPWLSAEADMRQGWLITSLESREEILWGKVFLDVLDCLRMPEHREQARQLIRPLREATDTIRSEQRQASTPPKKKAGKR